MARHTTCRSCTPLTASLLLAAIFSGCASQQTFRVVDARSGEPLADVRVERLEGGYRPSSRPFVVLNELSPAEKQTTSASGSVTFQKSGSQFMVNPSDTNPAYSDAYVKATWAGATVCYPHEHREFSVTRKDGVVDIPLRRRGMPGEAPRSDTASAASHAENPGNSASGDGAQHDDRSGLADTRPGN